MQQTEGKNRQHFPLLPHSGNESGRVKSLYLGSATCRLPLNRYRKRVYRVTAQTSSYSIVNIQIYFSYLTISTRAMPFLKSVASSNLALKAGEPSVRINDHFPLGVVFTLANPSQKDSARE